MESKKLAHTLFGILASQTEDALTFLKEKVGQEKDWRVQEILAQAFDRYCTDIGYEKTLPTIEGWLKKSFWAKSGVNPFYPKNSQIHKESLYHKELKKKCSSIDKQEIIHL